MACRLNDFGGIEGLVGGFKPVKQCLAAGECQAANCHAQAAFADDVLQLLRDGFDGRGVVAALQRAGIFDVLLAVGASPAMVIDPREAAQFAAIADALLINVGTLTEDRAVAMRAAVEHARQAGRPWTLDPVAVGALTVRTAFCHALLAFQPAAIRGNASEILALAGMSGGGRGVDTTDTAAAALPAAQALARQ